MSQRRAERQCGKLFGSAGEECIGSNHESAGAQLDQGRESRIDLPCGAARVWSNGSVRTVRCRPVFVGYVRVASVRPPYTKERRKAGCVGDAIQQSVPQYKNLNDVVIASQCSQHPGAVRRLSRIVRLKAAAYVHYRCSASHWPWHALFHVLSLGTDTESSLLLLCHFCCLRHASPRPGLQA